MANDRKVALIVGANGGVGAPVTRRLASDGYNAVVGGPKSFPGSRITLTDLAEEISVMGRKVYVISIDVTNEGSVQKMVSWTAENHGGFDVFVWLPSVFRPGAVDGFPLRSFDLMANISARAPLIAAQAALPHLRERNGRIVFISPPLHAKAAPFGSVYLWSKYLQTMLAEAITAESGGKVFGAAIWPDWILQTEATTGTWPDKVMRKPEMLADAIAQFLRMDSAALRSHGSTLWTDVELLGLADINDLTTYDVVPGSNPPPLCLDMAERGLTAAAKYMLRR